jgi:sarcosine oxidase
MATEYDVIVVGLGGMGSAAAYHLAKRGLRVLGIEQFSPAHTFGSSHGGSRIVRKAYFEGPAYVPLLVRSYQLWDELSAAFGEQLFVRCGALMMGDRHSPVVAGALASAQQWGLSHELLDATELRRRFPQFRLPDDQWAFYEADAGYARPEATVLANLELAIDAGAELWFDTVVESVQLGPSGVHVVAADEELVAPKAVLATGAWADRLAGLDRYPLSTTRQTVHWFGTDRPDDFVAERCPVYMWDAPGGIDQQLYGFPRLPHETGVKAAIYRASPEPINPDKPDRTVTEADLGPVRGLLSRLLPGISGEPVDSSVCMYPGAEGDDFVLGLHPGSSGRVALAIGFSGHGFKFTPVVGEIVADLVTEGRSRLDIGFLSPERFGR